MSKKPKDSFDYRRFEGGFLLSHPTLPEPFLRAVVWLTEFSPRGALGYVLSQPSGGTLGAAAVAFTGTPLQNLPLMVGGPVDPANLTLIGLEENVLSGQLMTHVNLQQEHFDDMRFVPDAQILAFSGSTQWRSRQLNDELLRNLWIHVPADFVTVREFFKEVLLAARFEKKVNFAGTLWSRILAKQLDQPRLRAFAKLPLDLKGLERN